MATASKGSSSSTKSSAPVASKPVAVSTPTPVSTPASGTGSTRYYIDQGYSAKDARNMASGGAATTATSSTTPVTAAGAVTNLAPGASQILEKLQAKSPVNIGSALQTYGPSAIKAAANLATGNLSGAAANIAQVVNGQNKPQMGASIPSQRQSAANPSAIVGRANTPATPIQKPTQGTQMNTRPPITSYRSGAGTTTRTQAQMNTRSKVQPFSFNEDNTEQVIPSGDGGSKTKTQATQQIQAPQQAAQQIQTSNQAPTNNQSGVEGTTRFYLNQGLSPKEARAKANEYRANPMNMSEKQLFNWKGEQISNLSNQEKGNVKSDQASMIETLNQNNQSMQNYFDQAENQQQSEMDRFERDQEDLFKDYDSNRMNQVRGQVLRTLAERGIDISKLSPEQLVALSGDVGTKAFSDVAERKNQYKQTVNQNRDVKLARIQQLRQNGVLSDNDYRGQVQSVNALANQKMLDADTKFANDMWGNRTNQLNKQEADKLASLNVAFNTGVASGLSGSALGALQQYAQQAGTQADTLQLIISDLGNKNSAIYQSLKAIEAGKASQQSIENAIKQYQAESDRIKALKSGRSGGSSSSSSSFAGSIPEAAI